MAKIRVRARTVDMLGRQQIAGIPNAINELFKNAHDAYADRAEIDYYRSNRLFVLRDDGFGMTLKSFETRWLTLSTDHDLDVSQPHNPLDKKRRQRLGEKGIGRLAISAIGPQVLILTKAAAIDSDPKLVVAYINWRIFESNNINVAEIEIPTLEFEKNEFPSEEDLLTLTNMFKDNFDTLKKELDPSLVKQMFDDISDFSFNPLKVDGYREDMRLTGDNHGTHFIIKPTSELMELDIDGDSLDDRATPLQKFLLGFTDTMTPGHSSPVITTAFRDHIYDEEFIDLVQESEFFTPSEFANSDHHIQGRFDEYGQFKGVVSVFGEEHKHHKVAWQHAQGKKTSCGPFDINLAVVQGAQKDTTIPPQEYGLITAKMDKMGGLYIYRDGIRILPYGNNDFDWLDIERNRTKGAKFYYFSFRRMMGVVNIDHLHNSNLTEKAGREGFRENQAYRQFQSILKTFFVQIAADFFRADSISQTFFEHREEHQKAHKSLQKREQLVRVRKKNLSDSIDVFFQDLDAGVIQTKALSVAEKIEAELATVTKMTDSKAAAHRVLELELNARNQLRELHDEYKIPSLRGIGKGKLRRDYLKYQHEYKSLVDNTFNEVNELIEQEVSTRADVARIEINRRVRVEQALTELSTSTDKSSRIESMSTNSALAKVSNEIKKATKSSRENIDRTLNSVLADFNRIDFDSLSEDKVVSARTHLENRIIEVRDNEIEFLQFLREQLESVTTDPESSPLDQLEALEDRNFELEQKAEMDLQLTQLGMAIEVINHEYDASIRSVRNSLRRLRSWADLNQDLSGLYHDIRSSFDHLDAYLGMFTPLHRRLYRKATEIRGGDIHKYISDLFRERFKRHEIELTATEEFTNKVITGYPSTYYPVFVNLVDNSIFWLKTMSNERHIFFELDQGNFKISDNGPGVSIRDQEAIFEYGFTRKPGGRGMGLYISTQALQAEGWDISYHNDETRAGASFVIWESDKEE